MVIDKDDEHACPSAVHGDGGVAASNGLASWISGDTAPRSLMVLAGGCSEYLPWSERIFYFSKVPYHPNTME